MNILFTICGRAGSKGIKNKNIKNFMNKPLPLYTLSVIDLYMSSKIENKCDIALNTDSKELINILSNNNMRFLEVVKRRDELALDNVAKIDVIRDTLIEMEKRRKNTYDMVVDLDITSPLRTEKDLAALIEKGYKNEYDVVFSVTNSRRNPYFNMVMKTKEGYKRVIKSNFNTRQEAPEIYDMNASMYLFKPSFLRLNFNIFDGKCGIIKMHDTGVLDLDSEEDLELMEVFGEYYMGKNIGFKDIYENI